MNMPTRSPKQRGFSLIEMMVVLGIVAVLMLGYWALKRDDSSSLKNAGVAAALAKVSDAAQAYAKTNSTALLAAAGPTTSVTVTIPQLIAGGGHLDPSFPAVNTYSQTWRVRYIEPSPGNLQALVDSYGGTALSFDNLAEIAQMAVKDGAPAGLISSTAPFSGVPAGCSGAAANYARGVFGDWCVMLANFGGSPGDGHLAAAVFYADASINDDFLHRTANADHQLNSMSTNIDMQGHSLDNVGVLNIPGGGNGINLGGSYLYGDGANLATRAVSGNLYIQSLAGASGSIVQVHNINGDSTSTFTAHNISASSTLWAGSAVVSGGDVTASGAAYASNWFRSYGATGWYSQSYGGGWYMSDPTWVRSYNDKNVYTGGEIRAGTIHATGSLVSDGIFEITQTAVVHGACSGTGKMVKASDGSGMLQCDGNSWEPMGGVAAVATVQSGQGCATGGGTMIQATCPAGYKLTGGGYHLSSWRPIIGDRPSTTANGNAPDASRPNGNSWLVIAGGAEGNSCFVAFAQCAK